MYWVLAIALMVFGVLTGFSIGQPFFLVGLALLVLGPVRRRPTWFWPPLAGVIAFDVGYWAVAPLSCTATTSIGSATTSTTVCSNLIGVTYSGPGIYNPPLEPAIAFGLVLAAVTFAVTFAAIRWTRRRATAGPVEPPQA